MKECVIFSRYHCLINKSKLLKSLMPKNIIFIIIHARLLSLNLDPNIGGIGKAAITKIKKIYFLKTWK